MKQETPTITAELRERSGSRYAQRLRKTGRLPAVIYGHKSPPVSVSVDETTLINLVRHGVYHLENLDLEELAADGVYEFAFVFCPLNLKGATGSPGNPIAVR